MANLYVPQFLRILNGIKGNEALFPLMHNATSVDEIMEFSQFKYTRAFLNLNNIPDSKMSTLEPLMEIRHQITIDGATNRLLNVITASGTKTAVNDNIQKIQLKAQNFEECEKYAVSLYQPSTSGNPSTTSCVFNENNMTAMSGVNPIRYTTYNVYGYKNGEIKNLGPLVGYYNDEIITKLELKSGFSTAMNWDFGGFLHYAISRKSNNIPATLNNINFEWTSNVWAFECNDGTLTKIQNYFTTGDYTQAINYGMSLPKKEFDFYYRTRYGAEFPWPDEPTPPGPTPGEPVIAGTLAHANYYPSGSHNIEAMKDDDDEMSKVVDVVTYNGLTPGESYIIVGKVFDLTDNSYISDSATEKSFTPADVYGDELVEFEINTKGLEGHTLVIFEELYTWDDHYLSEHSDRNDTDQYIYILAPYDSDEGEDDEEAPYFCAVDENFNAMGIVDAYESLIWTDRYDRAGDFELYTLVDPKLFDILKVDTYFYIPQSDRHMIVEKIEISSDPDEGDKLTITGRSLESILERRVVWKKTVINGNLQQSLKKIFEDNIINPPVGERRIANFVFKETTDPKITKLTLEAEYFGDNIYDLVCNVCQTNHIGFKIRLNANNQFVFELYSGEDRSYDNPNNNTYIIFSADFDNVANSNYIENKENYKNVALVGTSSDDTTSSYGNKDYTGLSRRETYVSATDIDKDDMSKDDYKKALSDKGKIALKDYKDIKSFDGTMLNTDLTYLRDYGLGDIVEFKDMYGHEDKSRISELIISHDKNGFRIYPSFETLEDS